MSPIQLRLNGALLPLTTALDDQANEIVTDLIKQLKPFNRMTETHSGDLSARSFYSIHGHVMVLKRKSTWDELAETAKSLSEAQFSTHDENVLYCEGTKTLLQLLTQYCSVRTEKALVMATPNARVAGGPSGGPHKAYINVQHLRTMYGKERVVNITVASEEGYVIFKIEENAYLGKLSPWLMADESAEEL
jgi:hypothetical protein